MPVHSSPTDGGGEKRAATTSRGADSDNKAGSTIAEDAPGEKISPLIRSGKRRRGEQQQQANQEMSGVGQDELFAAASASSSRNVHPLLVSGSFNPFEWVPESRQSAKGDGSASGGAAIKVKPEARRRKSHSAPAEPELSAEEFAQMSRSERKRHREKKRRSDVNKGFDDLMALLLKVDPAVQAEVEEHERCKKHPRHSSKEVGENSVLNRVELITRTIATLEKVHRENEELKAMLVGRPKAERGLKSDAVAARQAIRDNRVLMMIPFLAPLGPVAPPAPARQGAVESAMTTSQHPLASPVAPLRAVAAGRGGRGRGRGGGGGGGGAAAFQMTFGQAASYPAEAYRTAPNDAALAQQYFRAMSGTRDNQP